MIIIGYIIVFFIGFYFGAKSIKDRFKFDEEKDK